MIMERKENNKELGEHLSAHVEHVSRIIGIIGVFGHLDHHVLGSLTTILVQSPGVSEGGGV